MADDTSSNDTRQDCSTKHDDMSVLKAIEDKYLEVDTEDYNHTPGIEILHNLTAITGSGRVTLPQCLALNYCHINKAGDCGRLHELCRHVKELDMAENDLSDWNEILDVVNQLPHLGFLNLSSNPLRGQMSSLPSNPPPHSAVKGLALNNTKVPWDRVYGLLDIMPGIEELHLSLNDYRRIPPPPVERTYSQVKMLQFNENHISTWEELTPLGRAFPQLQTLILIGNKLSGKITEEIGAHFPNLHCLNLTNTCMASWEELESLDNLPALSDVRLQNIPFCESLPEKQRRQLCVARLGKVARLNGSPVSDLEREDADRAFLRHYMDSQAKPARYPELQEKYGKLDKLVNIDMHPPGYVKCTVFMNERSRDIFVDVQWTCKQLKRNLQEFAGMPSKKYKLFYKDMEVEGVEGHHGCGVELTYPNKKLYSLRVENGDHFILHKKWEEGEPYP